MQYVWVILLFLPSALSQRFRVVVPEAPVSSVPGSDVVLSCSVRELDNRNIMVNAVDLTVTWSRSDLKDSLVHLYENHKDLNTGQNPSYRGRTAVFKEELKNGDVSLKLSNVRVSDEGEYRCRVDSTSWLSDKTIKLSVEGTHSPSLLQGWTHPEYTGRFRVVVPEAPVFSVPGSDVVLPCSVREQDNPNIMVNAVDLNITWFRSDLRDSLVHLYGNHKDLNTDQNPSYRGRTAVFKEELKNGDASLKISNVRFTDEGEYTCRVDSKFWEDSKTFKLSVEVVGSEPVITVEKYESEKFSLLCESKGWHPEPELQWRNSKGVNVTAETETQAVADLFNVKSRITVEEIDSYYCSVTQRVHEKERRIDAQSLYEHVPNAWKMVEITIGVLLLVGVLAGVLAGVISICYERRKRQEVKSLLNSDRDGRLQHHNLSQRQWDHVEETLLNSEEDLKEFILRKFDPTDRGVEKLKKVIASSEKALLEDCNLSVESCAVLASVLKSENSLEELNLSQNRLRDSGVEKLCDALKDENCKLEILRLGDCYLTKESCAYLAEVLKLKNSKLKELNLSKNRLKDSGVKKLCDGLKNENCKLEKLRLEDCGLTEYSCADLANLLKPVNYKLIELHLSKNKLRDLGVNELCVGLKNKNCKLQKLRLEDCGLTGYSCAYLADLLRPENSKLTELHLSKNKLQDSGVKNLCDGLKDKNCKLQILRLDKCGLTEGICADLASVLKSENSKLIELNLSKNWLLDSGVKSLCDGLKDNNCKLQILRLEDCVFKESCTDLAKVLQSENSKLIELNLSKNWLEDSGVKILCDGLKNENCKLQKLRLAGCYITDEGFTALASALHPSSPLKELDLSRNEIKVSEVKLLPELRTKFPKLKVKLAECSVTDEVCAAPASENPSSPLKELDLSGNDLEESELKLLPDDDTLV